MGVPEANPIEWRNLFFWNQVQLDRMDFCSDALLLFRHGTGKVSEIWGKLRKIETKAISPRLRVVQMVAQFKANKNGHGKMRHLQSHFPMWGFPKSWGYRQSSTFMDDHDLVWINLW